MSRVRWCVHVRCGSGGSGGGGGAADAEVVLALRDLDCMVDGFFIIILGKGIEGVQGFFLDFWEKGDSLPRGTMSEIEARGPN